MVYWGHTSGGLQVVFWLTARCNHGHGWVAYSIEASLLSCSYFCYDLDVLKIHARAESIRIGLPKKRFVDKSILDAPVPSTAPVITFLVKYPHSSTISSLKKRIDGFKVSTVQFDLDLMYRHLALSNGFQSIQDGNIFASFTIDLEYIDCTTCMAKKICGQSQDSWFERWFFPSACEGLKQYNFVHPVQIPKDESQRYYHHCRDGLGLRSGQMWKCDSRAGYVWRQLQNQFDSCFRHYKPNNCSRTGHWYSQRRRET